MKNFFLFRWIQRAFFAVINLFRKKQIEEAVEQELAFPGTPVLPEDTSTDEEKYKEAKYLLDESLYGTWMDRPNSTRKKHGMDGWRHGLSHPFHWEGRVYDVCETTDESLDQYHELHGRIKAKFLGQKPVDRKTLGGN